MQQPQVLRPMPQQQQQQQKPAPSAPAQWQQAVAPAPSVVRGVAGKEAPKFVLPRPEALGVATNLSVPAPAAVAPVQVDWNQIQARLAKLNVVEYQKARVATGVQVRLTLPQQQHIDASGETEAAAILSALQQAEARRTP